MMEFSFTRTILALFVAILLPQLIKFITESIKAKKIKFNTLLKDGGMPSGHASFITAATTAVFVYTGFSIFSSFALAVWLIIIRDSFGLRYEVEKQREILEKIARKESNKIHLEREGHTPLQVLAGAILGFLIMYGTILL